jgi:hypothetical protein
VTIERGEVVDEVAEEETGVIEKADIGDETRVMARRVRLVNLRRSCMPPRPIYKALTNVY